MSETQKKGVMESLARGIIIGGSVGAMAGMFFMDIGRAIGLGLVMGFLAGLTHYRIALKRK